MKKILVFALAVLIGTNALGFGGGGHGRSSKRYQYGVDAIGTHVDPNHPIVQPDFRNCNDDETAVIGKCCPNSQVYTDKGVDKCCDANGYVIKNGACVTMSASASLTQNDDNYTFTWNQPGQVNGRIVERAAGSWILYYNATSRSSEVHDFTLDSNGNLKEEVWYPHSLEELENTPLKRNNTTSWLKELFGIKRVMAWTMNCSESGYGYMYNSVCGGCAGGASADAHGRCGFNTAEWKKISAMDQCVEEKGSWRVCVCGGALAKVNGEWTCSCPAGGSPSPGNYACCSSDGYAYNSSTGAYDAIEAMYCGCPTGTKLVNNHFCCDSKGYAIGGKNNKELSDMCLNDVCPNGGTLTEDGTCCKNGMA